jgi:REP element-mobilizing transposase RayT
MLEKIPLAYFITFTCYGTWLHGGKHEGSVDKRSNIPETPRLVFNQLRYQSMQKNMSHKPYYLDSLKRTLVLQAICEQCEYRHWTLLAAHIRTNHVHVIVNALTTPEKIMNVFKCYASRLLNEANVDEQNCKRWTRHGSTRYLWNVVATEAAINYVIHEQGEIMAVYENKERVLKQATAF